MILQENIQWKLKIQEQLKYFLSSLASKSINTQDKGQKKTPHIILPPQVCMNCMKQDETIDHPFLAIPWLWRASKDYATSCRLVWCPHENLNLVFLEILSGW